MNVGVPVVALTADADSQVREKFIQAGFDEYMTKPMDPRIYEEMIIKLLPSDKVRFV